MRYDERLAGWVGVERAMTREEVTRANCAAGRFTCALVVDMVDVNVAVYVGGRIVVFGTTAVQLLDADTGALLASVDADPVQYCVAARLVDLAIAASGRCLGVSLSVAGACVAYHWPGDLDHTVVHISSGPDNATVVRQVARVQLPHSNVKFELCERGLSYLLLDLTKTTLQLMDLTSGQVKRVFELRTSPPCCCAVVVVLLTASRSWDVQYQRVSLSRRR